MEIIILPSLRLAQLQTVTAGTLENTENFAELSEEVAKVKAAFESFQQGMTKSAATSNRKTLDKTRDQVNSGFFKGVESEQYFEHADEATKTTLAQVVKITDKYGYAMSKLPYDEQTAATDNMIAELESLDLSVLPNLARWIQPIKTANENFKQVTSAYLEGITASRETEAAYKAAEPLVDALNELYTILFAQAMVKKTDALINAQKETATLVNSFR